MGNTSVYSGPVDENGFPVSFPPVGYEQCKDCGGYYVPFPGRKTVGHQHLTFWSEWECVCEVLDDPEKVEKLVSDDLSLEINYLSHTLKVVSKADKEAGHESSSISFDEIWPLVEALTGVL